MSNQLNSTPQPPAEASDKNVVYDELVSILETAVQMTDHGIPYYAYGDNEAACELASLLQKVHDELRCAITLAEDRRLCVVNANN